MYFEEGIYIFWNVLVKKRMSDEKIVVGGDVSGEFAVARLNMDGTLDTDFGFNGLVVTSIISSS
jgi:hypothetical protein